MLKAGYGSVNGKLQSCFIETRLITSLTIDTIGS